MILFPRTTLLLSSGLSSDSWLLSHPTCRVGGMRIRALSLFAIFVRRHRAQMRRDRSDGPSFHCSKQLSKILSCD